MRSKTILILACAALLLASVWLLAEEAANAGNPGQEVDVKVYLRKGAKNIVDFYSEYCPPCRKISPLLEKLDRSRGDIVVVKLDINRKDVQGIDWRSPLAQQYGLSQIPHFKIYDESGKLKAEGDEAYELVMNWLQEAGLI